MGLRDSATEKHYGFPAFLFHLVLRFVQFVMGLVVVGLYGQYVNNARLQAKYADPNYVYAVVVGALASVTALIFMVPMLRTSRLFPWDLVVL